MEQSLYSIIDKRTQELNKSLPCCIENLMNEITVCPECKEWTGVIDSCCSATPEPDLCGYCYERYINYDY